MINNQSITEFNTLSKKNEYAKDALWRLNMLEITDEEIQSKLEQVKQTYDSKRQEFIDFMLTNIPKEIQDKLEMKCWFGPSVSDLFANRISFNAQLSFNTILGQCKFKYDKTNNTLLYEERTFRDKPELLAILSEYSIKEEDKFDAWLYVPIEKK